ncbi:MAG: succinate dehydrogenase, cytochrome b556 subunit [Alphaproteobacteria bacterium]|nr:succinate dehydrogenase, cytochrome b556 subunit [Alphaproteobacteria bacterium]
MAEAQNSSDHKAKRPLSPHLQVYRLPYNALMSISGRAVGIILTATLFVLCSWFVAVAWSLEIYNMTMSLLNHPLAGYGFLVWAFLVFFYIGNGVRHVLWNVGIGLNEKSGIFSGNLVLLLSVLLTLGLWQAACGCWKMYLSSNQVTIEEGAE